MTRNPFRYRRFRESAPGIGRYLQEDVRLGHDAHPLRGCRCTATRGGLPTVVGKMVCTLTIKAMTQCLFLPCRSTPDRS